MDDCSALPTFQGGSVCISGLSLITSSKVCISVTAGMVTVSLLFFWLNHPD